MGGVARDLIFIQGIMPRCGTNFLADLLTLHPDCAPPKPVWEHFLLAHSHLLTDYRDLTSDWWDPGWGVDERHRNLLLRSLGEGLAMFLRELAPDGRRVVTKAPSIRNLSRFPGLFPGASLVVLVRDGRSVVESGARTFGWDRERAMRRWARWAREILAFHQSPSRKRVRYIRLRYEDIYQDVEGTLRELFRVVDLDPERYDFARAHNLPVKGSSQLAAREGEVHWKPEEKREEFRPLERWSGWDRRLHERFNWVAGKEMEALDYTLERFDGARGTWALRNRAWDVRYRLRRLARDARQDAERVRRALRRRLRPAD